MSVKQWLKEMFEGMIWVDPYFPTLMVPDATSLQAFPQNETFGTIEEELSPSVEHSTSEEGRGDIDIDRREDYTRDIRRQYRDSRG